MHQLKKDMLKNMKNRIIKPNIEIFIPLYHLKYLLKLQRAVYRSDVKYICGVLVLMKTFLLMLAIMAFSIIINRCTGFDIFGNTVLTLFIKLLLAYMVFTMAAYLANKEMNRNR